jgi:tetratricopeptide (TPR) repeat protein
LLICWSAAGSRCLLFLTAFFLATALAAGGKTDLAGDLAKLRRQTPAAAPGTPGARAFAGRLEEIGRGYLEQGDLGRAVELLEEAYGWDERNGLVLAELTLAYVRAENFPFAHFYLELAEQRAPQAPPEIYATLGEVYYALNRVEDAVLAWEQFERLRGNDPDILRRLSRARQEVSLSHGQRFLEAGDFSIFSDAAVPSEMVEKVAERLASSCKEESTFFAARLLSSQVVVLYAGRTYFTLVSVPEWVSGVFDGKIRVAVDPEGGVTPQLERVLSHELAHAFIRQASRGRAPGWLHEGLAQWCEGRRLFKSDFRDIFVGRRPASVSEMEGNMARRSDRATARANYGESLGLIEYLIQHRGEGTLVCLLQDLAEGMRMEDALRKETSLNPEQLVSSWKTWAGL